MGTLIGRNFLFRIFFQRFLFFSFNNSETKTRFASQQSIGNSFHYVTCYNISRCSTIFLSLSNVYFSMPNQRRSLWSMLQQNPLQMKLQNVNETERLIK